ncbi:MAG: glutamate 5-kinase [Candidatus Geothermincolia bacterium]
MAARPNLIVVKIGTTSLSTTTGRLDEKRIRELVGQMSELHGRGVEMVLVTSGAIASGMESLGLKQRPADVPGLQAAASVGQGKLIQTYSLAFSEHGIEVGQILLTQFDVTHRQQYLNARNTLDRLLQLRVVPIVNENDTVAVEEINFGDNDTLAALVAGLIKADLLVALTDIDGLYTANPKKNDGAELIRRVDRITPEIERLAEDTDSQFSIGGMVTKIRAAKIAMTSQVAMVIANGRKKNVLMGLYEGREIGTYFEPQRQTVRSRKHWIAFGGRVNGRIVVDAGAKEALLKRKKSLLPAGVIACEGGFSVGDTVEIAGPDREVFARGTTNFACEEADRIKGMQMKEASQAIGEHCKEIIHRDCLVVLEH